MEALFDEMSRWMTVVSTTTFLGIVTWAYSKRRAPEFEAAAQLPFADDDRATGKEDSHV